MLADETADKQELSARPRGRRRRARAGRHAARRRRPLGYALAAGAVMIAALGVIATLVHTTHPADAAPAVVAADDPTRSVPDEASRGYARSLTQPPSPSLSSAPASPTRPRPVAGLSQYQMDNAAVIVTVGRALGLPAKAHLVALATALQESGLRNLANPTVPESMRYPHQGVDSNYDSVGLFQQRVTQGWGPVNVLMDPASSSRLFYTRLSQVPGWQTMSVTAAAQAVQRSAFPDAYAQQEARAQQILNAL